MLKLCATIFFCTLLIFNNVITVESKHRIKQNSKKEFNELQEDSKQLSKFLFTQLNEQRQKKSLFQLVWSDKVYIYAFLCSFQTIKNKTEFSTMKIINLLTKKGYSNILYFEKSFSKHSDISKELLLTLDKSYAQQFYKNEINTGAFAIIEDVDGSYKLTGILALQKKLMQNKMYQVWLEKQIQQNKPHKVAASKSRSFSVKMNKIKKASKKKSQKAIELMRLLSKFPQGKKMLLQFSASNRYSFENLELGQYRQDKSLTNLASNINNVISSNFLLLDKFKSYQYLGKNEEKVPIQEEKKELSSNNRHSYRDDDQALLQQAQNLYSSAGASPKVSTPSMNSYSNSMSYYKSSDNQFSQRYSFTNEKKIEQEKQGENSFGLLSRFEKDSSYLQKLEQEKKQEQQNQFHSYYQPKKTETQSLIQTTQKQQQQQQQQTVSNYPSSYHYQIPKSEFIQEYVPKESTKLKIEQEVKELRDQMLAKKNEEVKSSRSNNNKLEWKSKSDPELALIQQSSNQNNFGATFSYSEQPEKAQKLREMERQHKVLLLEIADDSEEKEKKAKIQKPQTLSQQIEQLEQQTQQLQSSVDELQHKVSSRPKPDSTSFLKQMLSQNKTIEENTRPSNYSEILKEALLKEKISQEEQQKKLAELQEKKSELEKLKEELIVQQNANSSEVMSIEEQLVANNESLEQSEQEYNEIQQKLKEMERIWIYTHPDAKIEDAMKEITKPQQQQEKIEEKPKDNFFSKLKNSLFSFEDDNNQEDEQSQNEAEMENALLEKFIDEKEKNETENLEQEDNQNNQEIQLEENNQTTVEQNETNEEIEKQEENKEDANLNETQALIQLPSDSELNELDFLDQDNDWDQKSNEEEFTVFNQNLATIINLNTQSISDIQVDNQNQDQEEGISTQLLQKKQKKNQNQQQQTLESSQFSFIQEIIKEELNDDELFELPQMNFQTQFLQNTQLDEQQKISLQFLSSQQCHHQSILPAELQIDFSEYLITHQNLVSDVYFLRHAETNEILSSENLMFTSKGQMKDGFLINDLNQIFHALQFQSPKTKENLILQNSKKYKEYNIKYSSDNKSLFSIISLNQNSQQLKLNEDILTNQQILIINNKTNSFLLRNQKKIPIFTEYNKIFKNYQIKQAAWMLHRSSTIFCQNIHQSVMIKPKFQQKFWNEQYFYIYNPAFNVYLTADLTLSEEATQQDDVFEIQFDKTQTQFSLISRKYQLPVQLNQNTNEIIINPLSYATTQQKTENNQKFLLLSVETSSTDFYILVHGSSQQMISVEQMENFVTLTKDDCALVFQLWELIPAVQLEE